MLRAARTAEFDHYQRNRDKHDRFRPMIDALLRAILEAATTAIGHDEDPVPEPTNEPEKETQPPPRAPLAGRIVTARTPRPRR